MIENHISGNLYNELLSKSSEEKCTAFLCMAWCLIVHKDTIKKQPKEKARSNKQLKNN